MIDLIFEHESRTPDDEIIRKFSDRQSITNLYLTITLIFHWLFDLLFLFRSITKIPANLPNIDESVILIALRDGVEC